MPTVTVVTGITLILIPTAMKTQAEAWLNANRLRYVSITMSLRVQCESANDPTA